MKSDNLILLLLLIMLLITSAGWYILGNSICEVKEQIYQQDLNKGIDSKKLQSLQVEKAELQAKIKRLNMSSKSAPGIFAPHLKLLIKTMLTYFSVNEAEHADWTRLLMLTVIAESDKGRLLRQVQGPAKGIFQCERETERDVLNWLKAKYPSDYQKIKDIRVPAKLGMHEAEYNLAYSTALCYFIYKWRKVQPQGKNTLELAKLYKQFYNTNLGKATVKGVLSKIEEMRIKI